MRLVRLILASASPRRRALLEEAGLAFEICAVDVDETPYPDEAPAVYVGRLARAKARAALAQQPDAAVLGADTTVVVDNEILAKPIDDADAIRMLERLSGRSHEVLTGVALLWPAGERIEVDRTAVWFKAMTAADIAQYVASGEPRDKAGAYAIQGIGGRFVQKIDGSHSNVVGLPMELVRRMLREAGFS